MINFLVDVGYYPATDANNWPANISDITFTDINRYCSIITQYDGAFPNSSKTIGVFQDQCAQSFGDDFLTMWTYPLRGAKGYLATNKQWMPSFDLMYPNMFAFVESSAYDAIPYFKAVMYFKKLGKIIIHNSIFNVLEGGTLQRVDLFSGPGFSINQGVNYPILEDGYTDETNLSTIKFSYLYAQMNTTGSRPSRVEKSTNLTGLNVIFASNPKPDIIPPEDTDPYAPGGSSAEGGGTGTFSETGDTIGIPGLPTLSAVDTGFITLFNPTAAQVKDLANYMWSSSFDLATFKNIVANPIDCILGLTIVPVDPPNAGSKTVNVGNIPTDVTLPYLSSQYVEVDCGTLNVQEFWGSYLDYSPYTKMSLYLPYIGIIPLDIDDVMNASIAVKYHVDVLSGACVAYVLCNGTQLYTYVGQCSSNVPITSNDFTNTVNGILGIAGSIGKLAADGGASAPTEAAGIAANAINALKPNIQKSGAMSGTGGLMGVQTPYLICQRPRQSVPASQNSYTGYPANITAKLSDLSGYTEIDSIHLDGLSATQEEQQEIMDLLTSGVII